MGSILLIAGFFVLPRNYEWIQRVMGYGNSIRSQSLQLNEERRIQRRFGNEYTISKKIADSLAVKTDIKNVLILIPPSGYFKEKGIDYPVPEPAVFYYFTGIKTTWCNSPLAKKANWLVSISGKDISVHPVNNSNDLSDSLKVYRKYNPSF